MHEHELHVSRALAGAKLHAIITLCRLLDSLDPATHHAEIRRIAAAILRTRGDDIEPDFGCPVPPRENPPRPPHRDPTYAPADHTPPPEVQRASPASARTPDGEATPSLTRGALTGAQAPGERSTPLPSSATAAPTLAPPGEAPSAAPPRPRRTGAPADSPAGRNTPAPDAAPDRSDAPASHAPP